MRNFIKKSVLILIVLIGIVSCERDDICPPTTATTPFLIVAFYDVNDPEENKTVQSLSYVMEGSTDTVELGTTDSILLPLNTNEISTRIQLISNTANANFTNGDFIRFDYQVDEVYINKACGFKANFSNLSATREVETPSSNNWIRSISVEQINVENEQNTHVFIFH
jgi:hypothetical protein